MSVKWNDSKISASERNNPESPPSKRKTKRKKWSKKKLSFADETPSNSTIADPTQDEEPSDADIKQSEKQFSNRSDPETKIASETKIRTSDKKLRKTSSRLQYLALPKRLSKKKLAFADETPSNSTIAYPTQDDESFLSADTKQSEEQLSNVSDPETASDTKTRTPDKKKLRKISSRLEYLARPKRDVLDAKLSALKNAAVPECALPSWTDLSLQTKLPIADKEYIITMPEMTKDLRPNKPDRWMDPHSYLDPHLDQEYNPLYDKFLHPFLSRDDTFKLMQKNGLVSGTGKVVCSVKEFNHFRRYLRSVAAEEVRELNRRQDEKERLEREAMLKDKDLYRKRKEEHRRIRLNRRRFRQNALEESNSERVMNSMMDTDCKILNHHINDAKGPKAYKPKNQQKEKEQRIEEEQKSVCGGVTTQKDVDMVEQLANRFIKKEMEQEEKLNKTRRMKTKRQQEWREKGKELEERFERERKEKIRSRKPT